MGKEAVVDDLALRFCSYFHRFLKILLHIPIKIAVLLVYYSNHIWAKIAHREQCVARHTDRQTDRQCRLTRGNILIFVSVQYADGPFYFMMQPVDKDIYLSTKGITMQ